MKLIMAVDENWAIGKDNKLLEYIPDDLKRFQEITKNKVVIMGKNTFESLPDKKPLKDRLNIVVSRTLSMKGMTKYKNRPMVVVWDTESLKTIYNEYGMDAEVFVIGGQQIINEFMDVIDTAYITKIYNKYDADTYIPNLDKLIEWEVVDKSEILEYNGVKYQYFTYKKVV